MNSYLRHFQADTSYEQATRIDALLRQPTVQRDVSKDGADDGEES